jgi:hypothetical protein
VRCAPEREVGVSSVVCVLYIRHCIKHLHIRLILITLY